METEQQIKEELSQFTGTQKYHSSTFGKLNLTDGINFLRNKLNCFWLIDIVESYQHKLKDIPFQLWKIEVNKNKSAIVTCREDTDTKTIIKQELEYTDFPLSEFEFYCVDNVILLKSEY